MTLPAQAFPRLFEPLRIGSVTLRNRIVSSGHDTVMAVDGFVTDRLIAYQEARAAGGVGLIVVQVAGVHESARYTSHVLMATDDACIPGYRRLAEAVHGHGSAIVGQIFHDGRELMESMDGTLPVALAPSAVPERALPRHAAGDADPAHRGDHRDGYASAARRLHDGRSRRRRGRRQPRLPARPVPQPAGEPARRTATAAARRTACGSCARRSPRSATAIGREPVVGLRISIDEITPEGLTPDDVLPALAALDADGLARLRLGRRRDIGDARRLGSHRAADDRAQRVHGAAGRACQGRRVGAGHGRRTHQPAAGGRAHPRARPGRRRAS